MQHDFMSYLLGFGFIGALVGVIVLYHVVTDRLDRRRAQAAAGKPATAETRRAA